MSWSRAQNDPSPMAEGAPRQVLRLSRPSSARRPTETDAVAPPMNLDHAAVDIMGAVKGAASSLGAGPVEPGGLTAAQVLENPAEAARAARWRTTDPVKKMTAVLARISQAVRELNVFPTQGQNVVQGPRPSRALPLRRHEAQPVDSSTTRTPWRWPARWKWCLGLIVVTTVLFPRIVALIIALTIRIVCRSVVSLTLHIFKELWTQAFVAAAEVEDSLASWLYEQLGLVVPTVSPAPPPMLSNGVTGGPPPGPLVVQPHPTRPVDIVMLVLLGLNLRRAPLMGGVGEARS